MHLRARSSRGPDRRGTGHAHVDPLMSDHLTADYTARMVRSTRWEKVTRGAPQRILVKEESDPRGGLNQW